ncbi:hypothetical protein PVAP13_2NG496103 [Panicum virgatum]|uniref:Uncharacterized protein n=1 Tax=Panicum virgatum TaxID=38727 RepID=A0A8T0VJJ6_PANVG|nr:hypothetical protein PVAP13_2NG496103 [Panicum virgatum]
MHLLLVVVLVGRGAVSCWCRVGPLELSWRRRDQEINQPERGENERERVNSRD